MSVLRRQERSAESGIALVISLVTLLILTLIGFGLLVSSDGSTRAETSFKAQTNAFEVADAGIEHARELIRVNGSCQSQANISALLAAKSPLVDFRSGLTAFGNGTNGTTNATSPTSPTVVASTTSLAPSSYQVFVSNNAGSRNPILFPTLSLSTADTPTSLTDNDYAFTLTSFASGPNGIGFAAVQADMLCASLLQPPGLPATLVLPGPDVCYWGNNSNPYTTTNTGTGNCAMAIGVTSPTAVSSVINGNSNPSTICGSNGWTGIPAARLGSPPSYSGSNYTSCTPPPGTGTLLGANVVKNFINDTVPGTNPYGTFNNDPAPFPGANSNLTNVAYLQNLMAQVKVLADFTSTSDPAFTLGNTTNPRIVFINGDFALDSGQCPGANPCAGILAVTGTLTLNGNWGYNGAIYVVGQGSVTSNGNGAGNLSGAMLAANTVTPWTGNSAYVGIPHVNLNGGGNGSWGYRGNVDHGQVVLPLLPPKRISFQQLR
jgi:Tfp pilus assembly protein PilX